MRRLLGWLLIALLAVLVGAGGGVGLGIAEDYLAARKFCAELDATGLGSQKCEVSMWDRSISFSIDAPAARARRLCSLWAATLPKEGVRRGSELRIYSPFSGNRPIAYCALR